MAVKAAVEAAVKLNICFLLLAVLLSFEGLRNDDGFIFSLHRPLSTSSFNLISLVDYNRSVYILENRHNEVFMHWFLFVIAGLYDLSFNDKPVYFFTEVSESFHFETIELIKPDFVFTSEPQKFRAQIPHFGAPTPFWGEVPLPYYSFVRNLILQNFPDSSSFELTKRLYFSRRRSSTLSWRKHLVKSLVVNRDIHVIRDVIDEEKIALQLNLEMVDLETMSLREKIVLIQRAKVVVAPYGGSLTLCFFFDLRTAVIELRHLENVYNQYFKTCSFLNINILQYHNLEIVRNATHESMIILNVTHLNLYL